MLGTIFVNNLIRGDIDSVDLLSRLTFNVPVRLMRNYYPINYYLILVSMSPFAFFLIIITTYII